MTSILELQEFCWSQKRQIFSDSQTSQKRNHIMHCYFFFARSCINMSLEYPCLTWHVFFWLYNTEAQGQLSCFHLKNTPRSIATCENWSKNCYGMLRTGASPVAHLQWNPSLGSTRHGEPQPLKANRCMSHWEDDSEIRKQEPLELRKKKRMERLKTTHDQY